MGAVAVSASRRSADPDLQSRYFLNLFGQLDGSARCFARAALGAFGHRVSHEQPAAKVVVVLLVLCIVSRYKAAVSGSPRDSQKSMKQ